MMGAVLHALLLLAMLLLERRSVSRFHPLHAALVWSLLGLPLMAIEAAFSGAWAFTLLQSAVMTLFFLVPAFLAFWLAKRRNAVVLPFLVFLLSACLAGLAAGLLLAHTRFALGNPWMP